jgi:hypothetical protein
MGFNPKDERPSWDQFNENTLEIDTLKNQVHIATESLLEIKLLSVDSEVTEIAEEALIKLKALKHIIQKVK